VSSASIAAVSSAVSSRGERRPPVIVD
jgi:hypothetical protein